jgi:hypothetical protein
MLLFSVVNKTLHAHHTPLPQWVPPALFNGPWAMPRTHEEKVFIASDVLRL